MATKNQRGMSVTLIRGRNYTLVHPIDRRQGAYRFVRGVPQTLYDADVVEHIRGLTDTVVDGDGSEVEKPMFRIEPLTELRVRGSHRRSVRDEDSEDSEDSPRRRGTRAKSRA